MELSKSKPATSRRGVLDLAAVRWRKQALTRPYFVHFVAAATLFVIIDYVYLHLLNPNAGLVHEVVIQFLIVVVSLIFPYFITYLVLRKELGGLHARVQTLGPAQATEVVFRLVAREVQQLVSDLESLKGHGYKLTTGMVPDWVDARCWGTMNGRYIGSSSHKPSTYMDILDGYLESHREYLQRTGWHNPDRYFQRTGRRDWKKTERIVFLDKEVLKEDWKSHKEKFERFVKWHKDNNVELRLLAPAEAMRYAKRWSPRDATDVGCWDGEMILIWHYGADPSRGALQLQMTFEGEEAYERCRSFLRCVKEASELFPEMRYEPSRLHRALAPRTRNLQEKIFQPAVKLVRGRVETAPPEQTSQSHSSAVPGSLPSDENLQDSRQLSGEELSREPTPSVSSGPTLRKNYVSWWPKKRRRTV